MNTQFGSGVLFATPNAGNLATNPTPYQLPILQEVQVDFKADLKKLYGQLQFPIAKARGKIDVSGKGKIAALDPNIFSQLYFGLPTATGVNRPIFNEAHAAAASVTPGQITAAQDLGVVNQATGENMQAITTGTPATGQYKFTPYSATGPTDAAYAFSAADVTAGLQVELSYVYPDATHGTSLTINNQLMGYAPEVQMLLYNFFRAKLFSLQLNSCVFGSISIPTKQEDFWIADFDFDASADVNGVIGIIQADL
jgi:hypothetical protein